MPDRLTQTGLGVRDAFDVFLSTNCVDIGDLMNGALQKSFRQWLDDHEGEIIEKIAEKVKIFRVEDSAA
jgi:hypothetical protein